ncbi:hypothetical protein PMI07_006616 [Rhizobium sp. CF080]|uniref:hypothetical protein n=1 Tax=Rhizobium sp. (strain CF080) TaxID=1144310 RepID=UPI0002715E79|nr:hypothetical protein [Rhizobium sp. CF080]EUB98302.1 hypothetical protein PMI07_006616 [Rhizobium sp. CF080]
MADEINPTLDTDISGSQTVPVSEPKKQRKPRTKKATTETVSAKVSADISGSPSPAGVKPGRQTRTRKSNPGSPSATSVRKYTRKPAVKPGKLVTGSEVLAIDELANLSELEQENQKLRKLLTEKLRGENADLRKKLGLG